MTSTEVPTAIRIEPSRGLASLRLGELWQYRELLFFLALRDVKVRYRQTALGALWALLQPLLLMIVFAVFLGRLARVPSDGLPYAVFAYAGLVPWTLFAQSLRGSAESLSRNVNLVSKVYFPRLLLPFSVVASFLLDFVIAAVLLVPLLFVYGLAPSPNIIWLPLIAGLVLLITLAVGVWLAALNARYRDVQQAVPFLIQVWMFLSPVVYPVSLVPERWQLVYGINPMVGAVEGFRWALFGVGERPGPLALISAGVAVAALVGGLYYFRSVERTIADVI